MTSEAELPTVVLKTERRSSHPWIFQRMVEKPNRRIPPGSIVDIRNKFGAWVGRGFYNGHSRITLRVLTAAESEPIDEAFFRKRIAAAIHLRRELLRLDEVTTAYRVIFAEGDELSGLVVDRFGSLIVLEFFAAGMFKLREVLMRLLREHFPQCRFYWFAEEHIAKQESFDCRPPEPPPAEIITEHGLKFRVQPGSKHKTGFFVDQRDNRKRLASFCAGKKVLDLCCNSGGFSIYAKVLGHADEVIGVDLDEGAIALAKQNAALNGANIRFIQADLFPWLRDILPSGRRFDTVILDPAKLTRDRETVDSAIRKYTDMNRLAMQATAPGGLLLTCSCTGLVGEPQFLDAIRRAAWQAGRALQILHIAGAGGDHPFLCHVDEGRYLKAIFCRVLDDPTARSAAAEWAARQSEPPAASDEPTRTADEETS